MIIYSERSPGRGYAEICLGYRDIKIQRYFKDKGQSFKNGFALW